MAGAPADTGWEAGYNKKPNVGKLDDRLVTAPSAV
jgi:hypothetical protein